MWKIDKTFEFDYGHSVWKQELIKKFSLCDDLMCRRPHGHRGKVKVCLSANELDLKGMVIDFKELDWFKKFIDETLDHKFIYDINDPVLIDEFYLLFDIYNIDVYGVENIKETVQKLPLIYMEKYGYYKFDIEELVNLKDSFFQEFTFERFINKYEGIVLVNFVPTSENLSKWFYDICKGVLFEHPDIAYGRVKVDSIEFWETPKSHTVYRGIQL